MMKLVHKFFPRIGMLIILPVLAFSVLMLSAQDEEPTVEPLPTEQVTDAPTDSPVPTDIPTEVPTVEAVVTDEATELPATEATTEAPAATDESVTEVPATEAATQAPETVVSAEPPFTMLMREMFDNGDVSPWNIGAGWSLVASAGGQAFQSSGSEALELNKGVFYNVAVQASFLSDTATAVLSIRNSTAGNYSLRLSPDGTVGLYRADTLVASGYVAASTSGQWRILRISAVDGVVRAAIDNTEVLVYTDWAALPPGTVRISASFAIPDASNNLMVDDFFLSVPVAEAGNYPAPTAYAPPAVVTEAAPATEATATEATPITSGEIKDYSPFPPPTAEQITQAQSQVMDTLGNDNWDGFFVPNLPYIVNDNTISDSLEVGEPASSCGIGMSNTVWFELNDIDAGSYRISSSGSDFDTIVALYTGASVGALTEVACNDDISATDLDSQFTANVSGGNYYIQVGGFNGRYGNYKLTVQLLGLAAPTVPTLNTPLNAARISDATPDLEWNAALNVYQYEVQWATNATFTANFGSAIVPDIVTQYSVPTLPNTPGTVYYWRVRAINGSGVASAFSTARTFTLDTSPLGIPNLTAPANALITTNSRPTLSWSAISGATYLLDLADNSSFSSPIMNDIPVTAANYTPSTSLPQGTYYWRVSTRDNALNFSNESAVRSFTIKILTAPANNNVTFTNGSDANLVFSWASVPGASAYTVQIDDDTDFSADLVLEVPLGNVTTTTQLIATGVYYWQVVPTGFEQTTGVYSKFTVSTPALAAPSLISPANATRLNDTTPDVQWGLVTNGVQYEVQWATNTAFTANMGSAIVSDPTQIYTLPTLPNSPGQIYYWHVRTINQYGVAGAYSAAGNFTLDTTPTAAANLTSPADGSVSSNSQPTFTWQAVSGFHDYFIDIDDASDFITLVQSYQLGATSFTLPTVLPQGTYYWRVRVQDNAGNMSISATRTITIKILTAPVDGTVIFSSGTAAPVLQWAAVAGVTDYTVQIDNDDDFSSPIEDLPLGNVLTYTPAALGAGIYHWQVFPTGFAPANPVYNTFTISPAASAAPGLGNPTNGERINDNTPDLDWIGVFDAAQYEVQWATNSTFTANMGSSIVPVPTNSLSLPTLPSTTGTVYYWHVRTINAYGVAGAYSTTRSFTLDTTPLGIPSLTAPADAGITTDSTPTLSWAAISGASYLIDLDDNSDFSSMILEDFVVSAANYTPITPLVQGTYYWRVQSRDNANNISGESVVRSFTVRITTSPANNALITTSTTANVVLRWAAVSGASDYTVQLYNANDMGTPIVNQAVGNVLTFTASALPQGVYYWQVKPLEFPQTSDVYSKFTITPGALAASHVFYPANGTFTNDTTPDVSWGTVVNAFQYEVQWATNTAFTMNMGSSIVTATVGVTNSLTLPTLPNTAGTVYYWRVRVINQFGVAGPYSPYWNFRLDTVAPNVPALVSPANGSTTTVNPAQFRWNAATGANHYELRYGTTNPPTIVVSITTISYTSPSPMLMQNYYWQVRALDAAGNASAWTTVREVKLNSGNTSAPIPNHYATLTPTLNWTPISWTSGGGYYQIQIDNNNNFSSPEYVNNSISGSPSVTTTSLSEGTWYWRVRACTSANVCGAWSTTGIFSIEE